MKRKIINAVWYTFFLLLSVVLLFPLVFMVLNSFMSSSEILGVYTLSDYSTQGQFVSFRLIPRAFTLKQYYDALIAKPDFNIMFWNSIILTVPAVVIQSTVAVLGAYGFSKFDFPFKKTLFFLFIVMMLMPVQVTLLPNYIVMKMFNLIGTYWAVILPSGFSAFGVFLLHQYMKYLPDECTDAAKIDGAGYIRCFIHIILPQCAGGVAALAILSFIDNWNNVEAPIILLREKMLYPLSTLLSSLYSMDFGAAFACGVLFMIPVVFLFLLGEEALISGIQHSSLI